MPVSSRMYSIFLPFATLILDLTIAFVYIKSNFWISGICTALVALLPLMCSTSLLFCGWARIQTALILLGFLHCGPQLILQLTLLVRYWDDFKVVLISYGTIDSPQYTIIVIGCLVGCLELAKTARECHFICQAPAKPLRVTASYFRASPFFMFHILIRGLSIGLVLSLVPTWCAYILLFLFLVSNLCQLLFIIKLPRAQALISSVTSLLTPSIFPAREPLSYRTVARFQIINSVFATVLICLSAVVAHVVTDRFTCDPQSIPHALSLLNTGSEAECVNYWAFKFGFLPYILIGCIVYVVLVVVVAGILEPGWLKLPSHPDSKPSDIDCDFDSECSTIQLDKKMTGPLPSFSQFYQGPETDI